MYRAFGMTATERHINLTGFLEHRFITILEEEILTGKTTLGSEEMSLVCWDKYFTDNAHLVDLTRLDDVHKFTTSIIDDLDFVQPDLLLFRENPVLKNPYKTRFAGYPDLIVEIFTFKDSEAEQAAKHILYATSPITEHWYLTQDTNAVERWVGDKRLDDLTLKEPLITQNGIEIDLTRLAL
ncbi:MAG: Uma2 family endonuclease [Turicibacter sp.]|nr:Uma2 family endonuclease [Turicibacter sp.]